MTESLGVDSTNKKTVFVTSSYRLDTDIQHFTNIAHPNPLPSIHRAFQFHIPQVVDPILLLDVENITIGRASGENRLDLSLQFGKLLGVSRNHAQLRFAQGKYYIRDLDSRNGTYINNMRLKPHETMEIKQNDQIRFGHFVAIVSYANDIPH